MQVSVPLDLEVRCWCCDGTGDAEVVRDQNEAGKCWRCDGIGYRLTDLGESIITMLDRHKPKPA